MQNYGGQTNPLTEKDDCTLDDSQTDKRRTVDFTHQTNQEFKNSRHIEFTVIGLTVITVLLERDLYE